MAQDARDDPGAGYPEPPRCSARGCRELAGFELRWRNPALHGAERTKLWLACAAHEGSLADFLNRRGFLLSRATLPRPIS